MPFIKGKAVRIVKKSDWEGWVGEMDQSVGQEGVVGNSQPYDAFIEVYVGTTSWYYPRSSLAPIQPTEGLVEEDANDPEYTGGSVSYYTVHIAKPTTEGVKPYNAECNDIIEALNMNYAEGNAFKALWRRCAARKGKAKKGYTDGLYDAQKVVFFGQRLVAQEEGQCK